MLEKTLNLGGVPLLVVPASPVPEREAGGTVLFYHGFTVSKEANRIELHRLARAGLTAVGVDAVGHGDRRFADFSKRFEPPNQEAVFQEVVEESAAEIPALLDSLEARGLSDGRRVGICGVSMGGAIAFGALAREGRLVAGVTLVSTPVWGSRPDSPHLIPERFYPKALLVQTAGADQTVPPARIRAFVEVLRPYYQAAPERLAYLEYPGVDHLMPARIWGQMIDQAVEWLKRFVR